MADLDFEAVTEWLEEVDAPDNVREAFKSSKLRGVIAEKEAEIARLKPFEAKVQKFEKAPAIKTAFSQVGVDVESLPKYARSIVENFDGNLEDAEAVSAYVKEWELPTSEVQETGAAPGAATVVSHATGPKTVAKTPSIDDQIAEAQAVMADPKATMDERQHAASVARSLKLQRIKPEGLTATSA